MIFRGWISDSKKTCLILNNLFIRRCIPRGEAEDSDWEDGGQFIRALPLEAAWLNWPRQPFIRARFRRKQPG